MASPLPSYCARALRRVLLLMSCRIWSSRNNRLCQGQKLRTKRHVALFRRRHIDIESKSILFAPKADHPTEPDKLVCFPRRQDRQIAQIGEEGGEMCALRRTDKKYLAALHTRQLLQMQDADGVLLHGLPRQNGFESAVEWIPSGCTDGKWVGRMLKRTRWPVGQLGKVEQKSCFYGVFVVVQR